MKIRNAVPKPTQGLPDLTPAERLMERLRVRKPIAVANPHRRALIYMRYSTILQNDDSITRQRFAMEEYCKRHNIEIVDEYADRAISGTVEDRDGLQRALEDLVNGRAEILLAEQVDRIARDVVLFAKVCHTIRVHRKELHTVADGHMSNHLVSLVRGAMASDEAEKTRERSAANTRISAEKGSISGVAYGYDTILGRPGERVIVEEEMRGYDRMCDLFLAKVTYAAIAEHLQAEGFPPPGRSGRWNRTTVTRILSNPIYGGVFIYGRNRLATKSSGGSVECDHPLLARNADRWRLVAAEIERRYRRHVSVNWSHDCLKGALKCGHCGEPMIRGGLSTAAKRDYQCYRTENCAGNVDAAQVQSAVLETVSEIVRSGQWDELFETYRLEHFDDATSSIRRELAEKERQKKDLVASIADAALSSWMPEWDAETRRIARGEMQTRRTQVDDRIRQLTADLNGFESDEALLEDLDERLTALSEAGLPEKVTAESMLLLGEIRAVLPEIIFRRRNDIKAIELLLRFKVSAHAEHVTDDVATLRRFIFLPGKRLDGDPYIALVQRLMAEGRWSVTDEEVASIVHVIPSLRAGDSKKRIQGIAIHFQTGLSAQNVERMLGLSPANISMVLYYIRHRQGLECLREAFAAVNSPTLGQLPGNLKPRYHFSTLANLGSVEIFAEDDGAPAPMPLARPRRPRTGGRRPRTDGAVEAPKAARLRKTRRRS